MKLPKNLILKQMEIGPMQNYQYFLGDATTKEIAVVDPAWDVDYLCSEAQKNNYKITSIFLTHCHMDHVNGLDEMLNRHDVPAYVSKHEADVYMPEHKNLIKVDDRHILKVGNIEFECFHTPGHSPGCHCFYHEGVLIAGDTIFIDGCGRCDLEGSNPEKQYHSLFDVVMKFPEETVLYTGHNYGPAPFDTLASQKTTNPYLNCDSKEQFLQQRMGISL